MQTGPPSSIYSFNSPSVHSLQARNVDKSASPLLLSSLAKAGVKGCAPISSCTPERQPPEEAFVYSEDPRRLSLLSLSCEAPSVLM